MVTMTRDLERGLIAAGVPEAEARAIVDGLDVRLSDLATREDLERELTVFRTEMALRFEAMEYRDNATDRKIDDLSRGTNQRFDDLNQRIDDQNQSFGQRFDDLNQRIDDQNQSFNQRIDDLNASLNKRVEDLNRMVWRIVMLLFTAGGALFGALMYSIFR